MKAPPYRMGLGALMLASSALFLLFVAAVFLKTKALDDGNFVYPLDDPYIHLALSEQIARGHYGLNPGEASSPGSSIVWPFLLAPFAGTRIELYAPLLLNVIFGLACVLVLAWAVDRWHPQIAAHAAGRWWQKLLLVMLLLFAGNVVGLTFVGMEHVLQVLLSMLCAVGLMLAWDESRVPGWCVIAAAVAPMVRYEDFALTAAVCLVLAALGEKKRALIVLGVSVVPVVAFGLYLRSLGLPMLPTSVLVKGGAIGVGGSVGGKLYSLLRDSWHAVKQDPTRWPVLALGVLLAGYAVTERARQARAVLAAAVLVAALQIAVGRFGWLDRYEVYACVFLVLIFVRAAAAPPAGHYGILALALFGLGAPYLAGTLNTPGTSQQIYRQQFQMRRFVQGYYRGDVAVMDIGLVSFARPPGIRILDIAGLASLESANQQDKNAAWLQHFVALHHAGLAIVFPEFLQIPETWTPMGKLCDSVPHALETQRCVVFYATEPGTVKTIRSELERFAPTLPTGVKFQLDPPRSEGGYYLPYVFQGSN